MDANTQTTLDAVHTGIVSAIQAQFPDLHVEAYRLDRKLFPTPACLIELTEFEAYDMDPGSEQFAANALFEARLIIGFRQGVKNPKLEIRKLAAAFCAFARSNRWGCPIGPAEVVGAYPDDFDPELDQYECWRVEWRQVIHLGESVWAGWNDGEPPSQVLVGTAPEVGPGHEGDYSELAP